VITDSVAERGRCKLERDLGLLVGAALADSRTVEIVLNADGQLWQERLGEPMERIGELPRAKAQAVIETVAGTHGKVVTREFPLVEGELPDGSRFAGQLPPVVSAPVFAIRKRAVAIFTLRDYVKAGIMTPQHEDVLMEAVARHRNLLIVGGTGSGKTTLVNALIQQMVDHDPKERVIVMEDTAELQCAAANAVQYHTTSSVDLTVLLRRSLRMRPDRILVGEVRGPEALDLLMAWNTGHPGGAATLHANSAQAGLDRLKLLISMAEHPPAPIEPLIAMTVPILVHIARHPEGRRIHEIVEVRGVRDGGYEIEPLVR
jgi:P-type conjugative transfer ATPase TrbB